MKNEKLEKKTKLSKKFLKLRVWNMSLNKWHNQPLDGILLNEKNDMMNLKFAWK